MASKKETDQLKKESTKRQKTQEEKIIFIAKSLSLLILI